MRCASSPPGIFSTFTTSAPMSASSMVHAGPAITCERSITFSPASGPFRFDSPSFVILFAVLPSSTRHPTSRRHSERTAYPLFRLIFRRSSARHQSRLSAKREIALRVPFPRPRLRFSDASHARIDVTTLSNLTCLASFETHVVRIAKGSRGEMSAELDRLKGSIPPLVTPFKNGEVDYDAYAHRCAADRERQPRHSRERHHLRACHAHHRRAQQAGRHRHQR